MFIHHLKCFVGAQHERMSFNHLYTNGLFCFCFDAINLGWSIVHAYIVGCQVIILENTLICLSKYLSYDNKQYIPY